MNWLGRWLERQHDLAVGVDADLVRDNHKRYRLACGLLGFGFVLGLLVSKVHFQGILRLVVGVIATVSFLAGLVLAAWARQEAAFLSKPDHEEPPKIFE